MKSNGKHLDKFRMDHPMMGPSEPGSLYGFFLVPFNGISLRVISSGEHHITDDGLGAWEHVSVSLAHRCPIWEEMCYVKDLFWMDGECVLQFHPPKAEYINAMEFCLHLWKSPNPVKLPPSMAVGLSRAMKRQLLKRTIR